MNLCFEDGSQEGHIINVLWSRCPHVCEVWVRAWAKCVTIQRTTEGREAQGFRMGSTQRAWKYRPWRTSSKCHPLFVQGSPGREQGLSNMGREVVTDPGSQHVQDSGFNMSRILCRGDPFWAPNCEQTPFNWLYRLYFHMRLLVAQLVKNLPAVWETWVWSLGWEDPLEKGKATHSSILA